MAQPLADDGPHAMEMEDDNMIFSHRADFHDCRLRCCRGLCCKCRYDVTVTKRSINVDKGNCCRSVTTHVDVKDIIDGQLVRPCYSRCCGDFGNMVLYTKKEGLDELEVPFIPNSAVIFDEFIHHVMEVNNHLDETGTKLALHVRPTTDPNEMPIYDSLKEDGCLLKCVKRTACNCEDTKITRQYIQYETQDIYLRRTADVIDLDHIKNIQLNRGCFACCCSGCGQIIVESDGMDVTMQKKGIDMFVLKWVKNSREIYTNLSQELNKSDRQEVAATQNL